MTPDEQVNMIARGQAAIRLNARQQVEDGERGGTNPLNPTAQLKDVLADLLVWADARAIDFPVALEAARMEAGLPSTILEVPQDLPPACCHSPWLHGMDESRCGLKDRS